MALPYPSKGKPLDPRSTTQEDRDTILMKPIPEVGAIDKRKFAPGKFSGRTLKIGKK